jgi:hypothetical protein
LHAGAAALLLELAEVVEVAIEVAVGCTLMAHHEGYLFGIEFLEIGIEPLGKSVFGSREGEEVDRHFEDEDFLGGGGGLIFGEEVVEEFEDALVGHDGGGAEAVSRGVIASFGFSFFGAGSCGMGGIGLVGGDLRGCCDEFVS